MVMTMTRLYRMIIVEDREYEGYSILLKCLSDAHKWFSRAKECRAEGKVKEAELFQGYIPACITKLLIISINRLMYLFRTVKTAQGLMSLTLPQRSFSAPTPGLLPVPCHQDRR